MNRQQQLDQFSLALHRRAFLVLHARPERLQQVRETLVRWRADAGETRSDALWAEWGRLLDADFSVLEQAALAETQLATLLRSVSPFGVLVSPAERMQLLQAARAPALV